MKQKQLFKRGLAAVLSATMAFSLAPNVGLLSLPTFVHAASTSKVSSDEYGVYYYSSPDKYSSDGTTTPRIYAVGYKEADDNDGRGIGADMAINYLRKKVGRTTSVSDAHGDVLYIQTDGAKGDGTTDHKTVVTVSKGEDIVFAEAYGSHNNATYYFTFRGKGSNSKSAYVNLPDTIDGDYNIKLYDIGSGNVSDFVTPAASNGGEAILHEEKLSALTPVDEVDFSIARIQLVNSSRDVASNAINYTYDNTEKDYSYAYVGESKYVLPTYVDGSKNLKTNNTYWTDSTGKIATGEDEFVVTDNMKFVLNQKADITNAIFPATLLDKTLKYSGKEVVLTSKDLGEKYNMEEMGDVTFTSTPSTIKNAGNTYAIKAAFEGGTKYKATSNLSVGNITIDKADATGDSFTMVAGSSAVASADKMTITVNPGTTLANAITSVGPVGNGGGTVVLRFGNDKKEYDEIRFTAGTYPIYASLKTDSNWNDTPTDTYIKTNYTLVVTEEPESIDTSDVLTKLGAAATAKKLDKKYDGSEEGKIVLEDVKAVSGNTKYDVTITFKYGNKGDVYVNAGSVAPVDITGITNVSAVVADTTTTVDLSISDINTMKGWTSSQLSSVTATISPITLDIDTDFYLSGITLTKTYDGTVPNMGDAKYEYEGVKRTGDSGAGIVIPVIGSKVLAKDKNSVGATITVNGSEGLWARTTVTSAPLEGLVTVALKQDGVSKNYAFVNASDPGYSYNNITTKKITGTITKASVEFELGEVIKKTNDTDFAGKTGVEVFALTGDQKTKITGAHLSDTDLQVTINPASTKITNAAIDSDYKITVNTAAQLTKETLVFTVTTKEANASVDVNITGTLVITDADLVYLTFADKTSSATYTYAEAELAELSAPVINVYAESGLTTDKTSAYGSLVQSTYYDSDGEEFNISEYPMNKWDAGEYTIYSVIDNGYLYGSNTFTITINKAAPNESMNLYVLDSTQTFERAETDADVKNAISVVDELKGKYELTYSEHNYDAENAGSWEEIVANGNADVYYVYATNTETKNYLAGTVNLGPIKLVEVGTKAEITYVNGIDDSIITTEKVDIGYVFDEVPAAPVIEGYTFDYWAVGSKSGEKFDFTTPVNSDMTLVAVYKKSESGSGDEPSTPDQPTNPDEPSTPDQPTNPDQPSGDNSGSGTDTTTGSSTDVTPSNGGGSGSGGGGGSSNAKTVKNADGSTTTTTTTAKGTIETTTKTNADGSKTTSKVVKNKDGSGSVTETSVSAAGTTKVVEVVTDTTGAATEVTTTVSNSKGASMKVTYAAKGTAITVSKVETTGKTAVSIPATVKVGGKTYKVTKIAANALKGNKDITKVTLGKNVKAIGKNAFNGDSKLKTIVMKKAPTTVGKNAFKGIAKKATIKIKATKKAFKTAKKLIKKSGNKTATIKRAK